MSVSSRAHLDAGVDLDDIHFARRAYDPLVAYGQSKTANVLFAVEATVPDSIYNELKARGHDVSRLRAFGMSGCATAVMIDPATRNRLAGADPRRDCYAIAY